MTAKEIRDIGAKAVAELRAHGGLPALADYIEALNATMDVSEPAPALWMDAPEGARAQPGTAETEADPANPSMPQ